MDLWTFLCKAKHDGTCSEASFACLKKKNTLKYVNFSVLCFDPGAGCLRTLILFNCHQSSYRVCCNSEYTSSSPYWPVAPSGTGHWFCWRHVVLIEAQLGHSLHFPGERAELWAEVRTSGLISWEAAQGSAGGGWGMLVGQEGCTACCCCSGPRVPVRAHEHCRQNSVKLYMMAINLFSNQILRGKHFVQLMEKGKRGGFRTGQKLCIVSL